MNTFSGFRHVNEDFFAMSGCYGEKLSHHPYIVFNGSNVEMCYSYSDLVSGYPRETVVLYQWPGKFASHFFSMTVGELIDGKK